MFPELKISKSSFNVLTHLETSLMCCIKTGAVYQNVLTVKGDWQA